MTSSILDVNEAATFLRVKRATIYAWVHQRRIPFRKHGRRLAFHLADLERWSASQLTLPIGESSQETPHSGGILIEPPDEVAEGSLTISRTAVERPTP